MGLRPKEGSMIRRAFLMTLLPGNQEEYERRHNPIWPELEATLKAHGVSRYSIFLERETDRLFAYAELESEELWRKIAETDAAQRWWAHMKPLMETNLDNSPIVRVLQEVFHID
jgi:L-rhamnose mutarotase